jgi:hypothetical protein
MTKENITEFDSLEISDLLKKPSKELLVAMFLKIKEQNGKVKFHDWFIKAFMTTLGIGILAGIVIGIINYCLV